MALVLLLSHRYEVPPPAVSVVLLPVQISSVPVIVAVGFTLKVTFTSSLDAAQGLFVIVQRKT